MKYSMSKSVIFFSMLLLSNAAIIFSKPVPFFTASSQVNFNTNENRIQDSLVNSALDPNEANWWNLVWAFRIQINFTATGANFTDKLIKHSINFTEYLWDRAQYDNFDNKSIRVIEYNEDGSIIGEVPSTFEEDTTYNSSNNATGILLWVLEGETLEDTIRHYFIYFDVITNGIKTAPIYETNMTLTENIANDDYTIENNDIRISMTEGVPPDTGSYSDHIYEVFNKNTGHEQCTTGQRWGWMLYSGSYGGSGWGNGVETLEVVYNNSIALCVKMVWNHTNFLYERFYTINYLDNSIEINHVVTAKTSFNKGTWVFASWWAVGSATFGSAANSSYGFGGYDFGNISDPVLGSEFTNEDSLYPDHFNDFKPTNESMREEAWFVDWEEEELEGVGTVWDKNADVSSYGYWTGATQEGRNLYMTYNPEALNAGQTTEFTIWGLIFNDTNGEYVKNRSLGLQTDIVTEISPTLQDSGKTLFYQLLDIDGNPIEGAAITLRNNTDDSIISTKVSDSTGNVTFKALIEDEEYQLWANYTIMRGIEPTYYLISNTSRLIDLGATSLKDYYVVNANLTKVNFYAIDETITNPEYEMLFGVNVSIYHNTTGDLLTYGSTAENGWISFELPAANYNVTTEYQGELKDFKLNNTAVPFKAKEHNFTISDATNLLLNMTINLAKTSFEIVNTEYEKEANTWAYQESVAVPPYSVSFYRGDALNFTFNYADTSSGSKVTITSADNSLWQLYDSEATLVDFGELDEITGDSGNYSLILDSTNEDYDVGSYVLFVNVSENSKVDGIAYVAVNILNRSTTLDFLEGSSTTTAYWNDNVTIQVQYQTTDITEIENIDDATLNYKLGGSTSTVGALTGLGGGIYEFEFNTTSLDVDNYNFQIFATKENFSIASEVASIEVNALETNISKIIEDDYRLSDLYMKVAYEENVKFIVNYTNAMDQYIPNAEVFVYFNQSEVYTPNDLRDGLYELEINSTELSIGIYPVRVVCYEEHHVRQTNEFDIEIMDFWDTTTNKFVSPKFTPWNNTVEYIFSYTCSEGPRKDLGLSDAIINALNVTVNDGGEFNIDMQTALIFNETNQDEWGYTDLKDTGYGPGYYSIWFSTGVLDVDGDTVFEVETNIEKKYYRPNNYEPDVWVYPPETKLSLFAEVDGGYKQQTTLDFDLILGQKSYVNVTYNVTDIRSVLFGKMLPFAEIRYSIYEKDDVSNVYIDNVLVDEENTDGFYLLQIDSDDLEVGTFIVNFSASVSNYGDAEEQMTLRVNKKQMTYDLGEFSEKIITTPENKPFELTISLTDAIFDNTDVADATLTFTFNEVEYSFTPSTSPGEYSFDFTEEMLVGLGAEESEGIVILVQRENYEDVEVEITINVGLPVDPVVGIPYRYWTIILGTAVGMVMLYAITKGLAYSRIPEIVKQIDGTIKSVRKNKKVGINNLRPTRDKAVADRLSEYWTELGLKYPVGKSITSNINDAESISSEINKKKKGGL